MSAGEALRAAVLAALGGDSVLATELTGIFEAPPYRSALPYAQIEEPVLSDWSTKDMAGREARLTILIRDTGEVPARLRALADAAEAAVAAMPGALDNGWRVAALSLTRRRILRERDGHWVALIEHRAAMLKTG